ncbi:RNA repair transcriptional activator RtcR family protein [Salinispira pacifica]
MAAVRSEKEVGPTAQTISVLLTFVGNHDAYANQEGDLGPVLSLLSVRSFSRVFLIYTGDRFLEIARTVGQAGKELQPGAVFNFVSLELDSPVNYEEIYTKLSGAVSVILENNRHQSAEYSVLLDPGTPQMQTVWFLLAKSGFLSARLLQGVPAQFAGGAYKVREVDLESPVLPKIYLSSMSDDTPNGAGPSGQEWIVPASRSSVIGEDPIFAGVIEKAQRVAGYDISVLIEGEPGTGKGVIARLIHEASPRRAKPFLALNCASIAPSLAESELFGHAKGAFTGAEVERLGQIRAADGGTIFLDEIGDLPLEIQPKLLRVLEEQVILSVGHDKEIPVDVRIIAATNQNLEELIAAGRFRRDLYDRLAQFVIELPPLRERPSDIPLLARHYLAQWNARYNEAKSIPENTMKFLLEYPWPGNVRELGNSVSQMCASAAGVVTPELLPPAIRAFFRAEGEKPAIDLTIPKGGLNLRAFLFNIEKAFYTQAIELADGNREKAASMLSLNGPAFRKAAKERFGL